MSQRHVEAGQLLGRILARLLSAKLVTIHCERLANACVKSWKFLPQLAKCETFYEVEGFLKSNLENLFDCHIARVLFKMDDSLILSPYHAVVTLRREAARLEALRRKGLEKKAKRGLRARSPESSRVVGV